MRLQNQDRWYNFWLERRGPAFVSCRFAELTANSVEVLLEDGYPFENALPKAVDYVAKSYGEGLSDKLSMMNISDPSTRINILMKGFGILEEVWSEGEALKLWRKNNGDPKVAYKEFGTEPRGPREEYEARPPELPDSGG